jgi:hypothetical protein
MPTYILSKEGEEDIKRNIKKTLPLISILYLPAIIVVILAAKEIAIVVSFLAIVMSIVVFVALLIATKAQLSIQLTLDNDQVILTGGRRGNVVIRREDVIQIVEIEGEGFRVDSLDPFAKIVVPLGLQNYDHLKAELYSWSPSVISSTKMKYIGLIVLALLIFVTLGFILKSKLIFLILLGLIVLGQIYRILALVLKGISRHYKWAQWLTRYLFIL